MVPVAEHEFFSAASAVAGALIGLLFVALSVWRERDEEPGRTEAHRVRAVAALTAFTNALVVSLFGLVPGSDLGETATIVAIVGLLFVIASALRLVRLRRDQVHVRARDLVFLAGGGVLFVAQLLAGLALWGHPHRAVEVEDLADLVIVALLFGIARSWELIGGPRVGVVREVTDILRGPAEAPPPAQAAPPPEPAPPPAAAPPAGD